MPHCDEVGHLIENDHCVATVHAEATPSSRRPRTALRIDGAEILHHRVALLELLQAHRQRRDPHDLLRRVLRDTRSAEVAGQLGIKLVDLTQAVQEPRRRD